MQIEAEPSYKASFCNRLAKCKAPSCCHEECCCGGKNWIWYTSIAASIAVFLIAVLVPMSVSGLSYDEYGLDQSILVNSVDYGHVYAEGNHWLGLNHQFIKFPSTFQYVIFDSNDLPVFSSDGLQINFTCTFQWRINQSAVPIIHKNYRLSYVQPMLNTVEFTIKDVVSKYSTDDFINKREVLNQALSSAVGQAVYLLGFEIPVDKFQFGHPALPAKVVSKYLETQVQQVNNTAQLFVLQQQLILQETSVLVGIIQSNATAIVQQAQFQAANVITQAQAAATAIVITAQNQGLANLFVAMNITDTSTKVKLRKLIAIQNNGANLNLYFGGQPSMVLQV